MIIAKHQLHYCLYSLGMQEIARIKEIYAKNYNCPDQANLFICNDNQTPEETANIIKNFIYQKHKIE